MSKFILSILMLCLTSLVFAQQNDNTNPKAKKVVVITEVVDEDGNVTTKKMIKEVTGDDVMIIKSGDGDAEIEHNVEVTVDDTGAEKKKIVIRMDRNGENDVQTFEWEGDEELPADILKKLEAEGINLEIDTDDVHKTIRLNMDDAPNQACLGVMIGKKVEVENINGVETTTTTGDSENGVVVLDVIDDSGAAEAGLQSDDLITAINGTTVTSIDELTTILGPLEAGAVISINYERNNASLSTSATLKTCNDFEEQEIEEEVEVIIENASPDLEEEDVNVFRPQRTLDLDEIDIFPNPTDGKVTVNFTAPKVPTVVKITDLSGREIYNEAINNFDGSYNNEIDLSRASSGAFILSIQQNNQVFSEKLILNK